MKRNISVIIKFNKENLEIFAIEKLNSSLQRIFYENIENKSQISNDELIKKIKSSIAKINSIIGGQVANIDALIGNNNCSNVDVIMSDYRTRVINKVTKNDISEIISEETKKMEKLTSYSKKIISVNPLFYKLRTDYEEKKYLVAPIEREGSEIYSVSAITMIPFELYNFVKGIIVNCGYKMKNISIEPQTLSNAVINSYTDSAVMINFGKTTTTVTIGSNNSIAYAKNFDYSYDKLIKRIKDLLDIKTIDAENILKVYGKLNVSKEFANDVVHEKIHPLNDKKKTYTSNDISTILKNYIKKMFIEINSFLMKKTNYNNVEIYISGEIIFLDDLKIFSEQIIDTKNLLVFKPLDYLEMEKQNLPFIGFVKYMDKIGSITGKKLDSNIKTNTKTINLPIKRKNRLKSFIIEVKNKARKIRGNTNGK
ncbi:MAG: hypothetical protein NC236_01435 [Mycoplasma sp.]|nr:hypothetical protein [Mycoplasma sp.]